VTLLTLAIFNGFTGYSLPDDLLSGTGLRIAYSIVLSIPFVGTWVAFLLFGGEFPSTAIISRFLIIHIMLVPGVIFALLGAHLGILWRQKHTQFAGRGRRDDNVVGPRLWPTYAAKSIGLFFAVAAVLCALGGLVQINPVWLFGPFTPAAVSTAAQPDWYVGWLEGALRVAPAWRLHIFGHTIPEVFVPGAVLPGATFVLLYAWPFLEQRFTGDRAEHHILDRPRDRPVRTAIGIGVLTFYIVLLAAGGQDIIAQKLQVSIRPVLLGLRLALVGLPLAAALFTWKLCRDLAKAEPLAEAAEETEPPVGLTGTRGAPRAGDSEAAEGAGVTAGASSGHGQEPS
jgi:ubiquinol-cytochrome c reductase cytochrome b subunit